MFCSLPVITHKKRDTQPCEPGPWIITGQADNAMVCQPFLLRIRDIREVCLVLGYFIWCEQEPTYLIFLLLTSVELFGLHTKVLLIV